MQASRKVTYMDWAMTIGLLEEEMAKKLDRLGEGLIV